MFVRGSERGRKESCDMNPPPAEGGAGAGWLLPLWQGMLRLEL